MELIKTNEFFLEWEKYHVSNVNYKSRAEESLKNWLLSSYAMQIE